MNKRKSKKEWEKIVEEFKTSGLNLSAWCRKNNVSKSTIYPYVKKFNSSKNPSEQNWVSVPIPQNTETATFSLKVGAATLDIKKDFDKNALEDILAVVMKLC